MSSVTDQALALWGMAGATCTLAAAAQGGISVPAPVPSTSGEVLHIIGAIQIDMLTWLEGAPMLHPDPAQFHALGHMLARLHRVSDGWTPPRGFTRCAWDRAGLLGDAPLWGRFWDHPDLDTADRALFSRLRARADTDLERLEPALDYGLIHADPVPENILIAGSRQHLIDFDDGGYGFRLFDLATALLKHRDAPDYPALLHALVAGYRTLRPLDTRALDLFMVLRAATYVGWIVPRRDEDGAQARSARFVTATRMLAQAYLDA